MTKTLINDLTTGSVGRKLLRFALPFTLSNLLQLIYNMVDMLVVGQYVGSAGLSAVSISGQVVMLMTTISMGFSTSGQVYVAQQVGAGDGEGRKHTIGTLFTFLTLMSLGMTLVALTCATPLLRLLDTPQESFEAAKQYIWICGGGIFFTYGYNMVSAVLRGMGDSKRPLLFIAIASLTNLILDLLFVGPLHMGVAGAALATILGQALSFVVSILFLYKRRESFGFDFKPQSFKMHPRTLSVLVKLGIPFALQSSAISISMLFVNRFVNGFGVFASATFGVGCKVSQIPDMIGRSVGMAASAMVAQNMGAGEVRRAQKTIYVALACTFTLYSLIAIPYALFPREIFSAFTSDPEVLALAWTFLSTALIGFPAHALMTPTSSFVQGIGNAAFSLPVALFDGVVLRISLSLLLGIVCDMGLYGFFLGYNLATYGTAIPCGVYFFSGIWKKRKMLASKQPVNEAEG